MAKRPGTAAKHRLLPGYGEREGLGFSQGLWFREWKSKWKLLYLRSNGKEKERNLQMIWKLGVDDCDFLRGNSEYFRTIHSLKKP